MVVWIHLLIARSSWQLIAVQDARVSSPYAPAAANSAVATCTQHTLFYDVDEFSLAIKDSVVKLDPGDQRFNILELNPGKMKRKVG